MTADPTLLERAGDLKRELVEFAQTRRFARALWDAQVDYIEEFGGDPIKGFINFLDYFILQYRLRNGRTVVEEYVNAHPDLPERERVLLLGWKDVVEGYFEIVGHEEETLIAENLVDDLTYRIRSNMGMEALAQFPVEGFLKTRIVPIGDEWMLSGLTYKYTTKQRQDVYRAALELALAAPRLVFRNPEHLEQARQLQREDRREFLDFFGTDMLTVPIGELSERMEAYARYKTYEVRDAEGLTRAEQAKRAYGTVPPLPTFPMPEWEEEPETIVMFYDEQEGLNFYPDYGLVEEAFANPELVHSEPYRSCVREYIQEPDIPAALTARLAERNPERADQVFRLLFNRPRFSWKRNGEKFLQRYKPRTSEPLPGINPLSERLVQAFLTPSRPAKKSRRLFRKRE